MPPETDNLKLKELFDDDQTDREKVFETKAEVDKLKECDTARRKRLTVMMELGEVRTKNDLYHTAVIFQHGDCPSDFLSAHRFATLAAILGHRTARWLLASALDRYLMSIAQGQIYGTQFEFNGTEKRYQLKLPVQDPMMLPFEKEMLAIPPVNERLGQLDEKIKQS